jgi:hypothetical protein
LNPLNPNLESEESLRSEVSRRQRIEESVEIKKNRNNLEKSRNYRNEDEDLEPDSTKKVFDSSGAGDGVLFYRKALAFLKLKNLNRDKKHRVFNEMKEELAANNEAMSSLEQRLGDYSVMIKVCVAVLPLPANITDSLLSFLSTSALNHLLTQLNLLLYMTLDIL